MEPWGAPQLILAVFDMWLLCDIPWYIQFLAGNLYH